MKQISINQEVGDDVSVCVLHKDLLILSVFSLTTLVFFEKVLEEQNMNFNAPENDYILPIFKIETPPEAFISYKFHNSSFYTNCFEIYTKSLLYVSEFNFT